MLRNLLLTGAALIFLGVDGNANKNKSWTCLPDGINAADIVSTREVQSTKGRREFRKITVEQKLKDLKARCRKGKLDNASGIQIRLYKLAGGRGHPSDDDREVLERHQQERVELRKSYRVSEMTCN